MTLAAAKLTPNVGAEITGVSGQQLVDPGVAAPFRHDNPSGTPT